MLFVSYCIFAIASITIDDYSKNSARSEIDGSRTRFSRYILDFDTKTHDNTTSKHEAREFRVVWVDNLKPPEAVDSPADICGFAHHRGCDAGESKEGPMRQLN